MTGIIRQTNASIQTSRFAYSGARHATPFRRSVVALVLAGLVPVTAFAQDVPMPHAHAAHTMASDAAPTPLAAPGNDAFGAIQEAVRALEADPRSDWSRTDFEALRRHLVDMRNMTLEVSVHAQRPVPGGVEIRVSGNTPAADASLARVFAAHPAQLAMETGWRMTVRRRNTAYVVVVTTPRPDEVAKVRGLGYIGLLAIGSHHQVHHWAMVRGIDPHRARPATAPD